MDNILKDSANDVYYVLKVNGNEVTPRFSNPAVAEAQRPHLPADQQNLAIMETVTSNGDQMLLG